MTNPTTLITLAVHAGKDDSKPADWDWSALTEADAYVVGASEVSAPMVSEPMTFEQADAIRDDEGFVTVVVDISLDDMLDAAREAVLDQDNDHFDFIHGYAFDFGIPHDCSMRVVGVRSNGTLVVEYRTLMDEGY